MRRQVVSARGPLALRSRRGYFFCLKCRMLSRNLLLFCFKCRMLCLLPYAFLCKSNPLWRSLRSGQGNKRVSKANQVPRSQPQGNEKKSRKFSPIGPACAPIRIPIWMKIPNKYLFRQPMWPSRREMQGAKRPPKKKCQRPLR